MQIFIVKISGEYPVTTQEIKEAIWYPSELEREQIEVVEIKK